MTESARPQTHESSTDLVRQVVVLIGALVAVAAAFVGSTTAGNQIGDGALAPEATLIAPGRPAFSIWSVIYIGLVVWAVRQVLPGRRSADAERRTGWLLLASLILNALWIAVVQAGLLGASVPVIVTLLAVLAALVIRLREHPSASALDRVVMDGTSGLYLGWVSVATVANVAAVLTSAGYTDLVLGGRAWAVVVLLVAGAVGVGLALWHPAMVTGPLAIAWGVAWIAIARSTGQPRSGTVAVTAAVVAAVVLLVGLALWVRSRRVAG